MTKKDLVQMQKMMILTFNDGFEQVVVPRLEEMEERFDKKLGKMGKELREEFKRGQQNLSNTLEEVVRKVDGIAEGQKDDRRRLEKVERIVKAN